MSSPTDVTTRRVADSATQMTEIVLPQHTNALATVFGGQMMAWIDVCAAVCAQRYCGRVAVTASVDEMVFQRGARLGEVVVLKAWVNAAFNTSVEVEVVAEVESVTGDRSPCVHSYLTFVAIDDEKRPVRVPRLEVDGSDERAREKAAHERRRARLVSRRAAKPGA